MGGCVKSVSPPPVSGRRAEKRLPPNDSGRENGARDVPARSTHAIIAGATSSLAAVFGRGRCEPGRLALRSHRGPAVLFGSRPNCHESLESRENSLGCWYS